jgi:hypothetical protein
MEHKETDWEKHRVAKPKEDKLVPEYPSPPVRICSDELTGSVGIEIEAYRRKRISDGSYQQTVEADFRRRQELRKKNDEYKPARQCSGSHPYIGKSVQRAPYSDSLLLVHLLSARTAVRMITASRPPKSLRGN